MTEQKMQAEREREMKNYSKKTTDVFWVGVGGGFPEYLLLAKLNHTRAGKTGYRALGTLCFQ